MAHAFAYTPTLACTCCHVLLLVASCAVSLNTISLLPARTGANTVQAIHGHIIRQGETVTPRHTDNKEQAYSRHNTATSIGHNILHTSRRYEAYHDCCSYAAETHTPRVTPRFSVCWSRCRNTVFGFFVISDKCNNIILFTNSNTPLFNAAISAETESRHHLKQGYRFIRRRWLKW